MNVIEINNLSKYYRRSCGIEDVSFNVSQGDIFGFIGPNGSGKSTTIRILLNLIFPTSGSARIFGFDVVKDSKKIRARTGYVPSDANLYDWMKVHEFLSFGASLYGMKNSNDRIRSLGQVFDLDLSRNIRELSTGNKKKVAILQALIHRPQLLILDEPTTGLDPLIQSRFFDLLHQENNNGTTILFSSHILSEVQALCNTVAIVKEGKIVREETVSSLRDKQLKKVRIVFQSDITIQGLGISGIESAESEAGKILSFLFSGNINELIGKLSAYRVESLSIEEPPLEEIFLHYYQN